jgi:hypothetical protein
MAKIMELSLYTKCGKWRWDGLFGEMSNMKVNGLTGG